MERQPIGLEYDPDPASFREVARVARHPVGDVDGGVDFGVVQEPTDLRVPRARHRQSGIRRVVAKVGNRLGRGSAEESDGGGRTAEGAGDPDLVARSDPAAAQWLSSDLAERGDREMKRSLGTSEVTADHGACRLVGGGAEPL